MHTIEKLLPAAAAVLLSFSALAASAASYAYTSQQSGLRSASIESRMIVTSAKGHPGEVAPAMAQDADIKYGFSATPSPNKDDAPFPVGD